MLARALSFSRSTFVPGYFCSKTFSAASLAGGGERWWKITKVFDSCCAAGLEHPMSHAPAISAASAIDLCELIGPFSEIVVTNSRLYYGRWNPNVLPYQFHMSSGVEKTQAERKPEGVSGGPGNRTGKFVEAMGLRRSIVGILCMAVLVGMGERMSERFLPIYLIALGSGMLWPGFLNAINNLVSALYSFPGGWLAERIGPKKSLLVFNLMAIAGFGIVAT